MGDLKAKSFSASSGGLRNSLDDYIVEWMSSNLQGSTIIDVVIVQSSNDSHHCISAVIFYVEGGVRSKYGQMTGVKIFTCTRHHEKEQEGDKITEWLRDNPDIQILEKMVLQSSDISHHCLTVAIFYHDPQANQ